MEADVGQETVSHPLDPQVQALLVVAGAGKAAAGLHHEEDEGCQGELASQHAPGVPGERHVEIPGRLEMFEEDRGRDEEEGEGVDDDDVEAGLVQVAEGLVLQGELVLDNIGQEVDIVELEDDGQMGVEDIQQSVVVLFVFQHEAMVDKESFICI